MIRLLVIEDEIDLANNISELIKNKVKDIEVYVSNTIKDAKKLILKYKPSILVLDINLPDGRGTDLYKEYKEVYPEGVVIFLTAIDSDIEKLIALELGAEDYITKPFNPNELSAKINNWVRRLSKQSREYVHVYGDYYFDKFDGSIVLYKNGFYHTVDNLSYRESKIFEILINNVNKVIDVGIITNELDIPNNQIPWLIYSLRRKISKVGNIKILAIKGGKLKLVLE